VGEKRKQKGETFFMEQTTKEAKEEVNNKDDPWLRNFLGFVFGCILLIVQYKTFLATEQFIPDVAFCIKVVYSPASSIIFILSYFFVLFAWSAFAGWMCLKYLYKLKPKS